MMSSSESSLIDLLNLWSEELASGSNSLPVRREIDLPFLVLTSSAGRPVWLNPPSRLSLSSLELLILKGMVEN